MWSSVGVRMMAATAAGGAAGEGETAAARAGGRGLRGAAQAADAPRILHPPRAQTIESYFIFSLSSNSPHIFADTNLLTQKKEQQQIAAKPL